MNSESRHRFTETRARRGSLCVGMADHALSRFWASARLFASVVVALFAFFVSCPAVGKPVQLPWQKLWTVESESPHYSVTPLGGDTLEIRAPKGLTLWYNSRLRGDVTVEYDAQVVVADSADRLSDLNSFFMASDPTAKSVFVNMAQRGGVFARQTALQMYYLGYGGNYNTTTRFRRYTGAGRPPVITEYTDSAHLLQANHWYHVRMVKRAAVVRYYVDGECIVDYTDPSPLSGGWFGFRTTLSRTRVASFRAYATPAIDVPLHWVGAVPDAAWPVSFGVPFAKGEMSVRQLSRLTLSGLPCDTWVNARWPDGSVKWAGVAAVVPGGDSSASASSSSASVASSFRLVLCDAACGIGLAPSVPATRLYVVSSPSQLVVSNGSLRVFFPRRGSCLIDSVLVGEKKVAGAARWIVATTRDGQSKDFANTVDTVYVERTGQQRVSVRVDGHCSATGSAMTLPYTLRFYIYNGSNQLRLVHTFVYDGCQDSDFVSRLGLRFAVPLRDRTYNRQVAFSADSAVWMEPVQPLVGRRPLSRRHDYEADQLRGVRVPDYADMDSLQRSLIDNWAEWDGYRLLQLNDGSFTIRKRATAHSPWIGTFTGHHSDGMVYVGDCSGGLAVSLRDFWQSYPKSLQVDGARGSDASLIVWLWSPEAEPMDLRHYDDRAHSLEAAYEDVQDGLSTTYGIARTHSLTVMPFDAFPGIATLGNVAKALSAEPQLLPTPEYLHDKKAFGVWSLKRQSRSKLVNEVEAQLDKWIGTYKQAVATHHWYGFWNYGDVMHAYDADRGEWLYDVGGYAWDNTELASPDWLWYEFLRTGRSDIYAMALAMTRHNSEVDTYHLGPLRGLGSRHNVSHWGCGAKEARISQSAFSRFAYYLTTDDRLGDIMHDETDADTLLYHVDPMRLAEPRSQFPCSAPARLRIGPDWLAYVGNWMTEWERTGNTYYRDKIVAGMKSIAALPDGVFTGNLAKGYDPKTGVLSYDGDPAFEKTNHLMTIMGGFEIMNELRQMITVPEFERCWLDFATRYKQKARDIMHNHFPVRRLEAYAAWKTGDKSRAQATWQSLLKDKDILSTNNAALWSLDAIYMLEALPTE